VIPKTDNFGTGVILLVYLYNHIKLVMKNKFSITYFLICVLSVILTGCEKKTEDANSLLIGKWDQVSLKTVNYYDNVKQNETERTYDAGYIVMEIHDDGTAKKYIQGVISDAFYWDVEGELLLMTGNSGIVQTAEFSVNDNNLTLMWAVQETSDGHIIRSDYMGVYKKQ